MSKIVCPIKGGFEILQQEKLFDNQISEKGEKSILHRLKKTGVILNKDNLEERCEGKIITIKEAFPDIGDTYDEVLHQIYEGLKGLTDINGADFFFWDKEESSNSNFQYNIRFLNKKIFLNKLIYF